MNATCDDPINGYDRCKCTASNNFYLSPSSGCLKLPPPIDCQVYNSIDEDLDLRVFDIFWNKQDGAFYSAGTYFQVQYDSITIKSTAYQAYQQGNIPGTTEVTVRAVYDDPVNGLVYSDTTQLLSLSMSTDTDVYIRCTFILCKYFVINYYATDAPSKQWHQLLN